MLELPAKTIDGLPRQIWLTPRAQQRWGVERLVLQQQQDGRIGLVVHGLDQGVPITPDSQSTLQQNHEQRLLAVLQDLEDMVVSTGSCTRSAASAPSSPTLFPHEWKLITQEARRPTRRAIRRICANA